MNAPERFLLLLACAVCCNPVARAELLLPRVFAHHMVLQAQAPLPVWGAANPGVPVTVSLGNDQRTSVADAHGQWRVTLPPREASLQPSTLRVRSPQDELVLRDVLVGEVWLCAGQSNMEWPLKQASDGAREVKAAEHPEIRLLNLVGAARGGAGAYSSEELDRLAPAKFCEGSWTTCAPASVGDFSAVGYFFGRRLHLELGVPIGLISPAIGGTPTEAWIARAALAADAELAPLVRGNWLENLHLEAWCQQRATDNLRRATEAGEEIPGDDLGPHHSFKPGFMWEAAVQPLVPFAIRGVLWYQGESNAESHWRAVQHGRLFELLVRDWRQQWGQGDFPFLYVQLPAMGRPNWPVFREGQRRMLQELPRLGMAVTIDVGHPTNVHPVRKRPVGERLARWALAGTYGRDTVTSGPLFRSHKSEGGQVLVEFDYAQGGLATRDGGPVVGFEVAGQDGRFHPARADLRGASVVVSAPQVSDMVHVRYGWVPYPDPPLNLVNREGLPASPFSTFPILAEARP
jgi:sialate O-acetylesterase